jgi:hypothetical protein
MWSLSIEDKDNYKALTNHDIEQEEIDETRQKVVKKGRDGS